MEWERSGKFAIPQGRIPLPRTMGDGLFSRREPNEMTQKFSEAVHLWMLNPSKAGGLLRIQQLAVQSKDCGAPGANHSGPWNMLNSKSLWFNVEKNLDWKNG